jgi:hypothetical protein
MKELAAAALLMLAVTGAAAQIPPDGIIRPGQTVTIGPGTEERRNGPILVYGGRLLITGAKLFLNGHMTIAQGGEVVFDAAEFHHEGEDTHVFVGGINEGGGDGLLALRNGSRLHWAQSYVSQHELHARNGSRIELDRARVDCDAATGVIRLFDQAAYSATATTATKEGAFTGCWSTWYMSQQSQLQLDAVMTAGDVVFYDAARIVVRNTIGIMPWLYFPRGAVADLSFPDASQCDATRCPAVSKTIDAATVKGIEWSVQIEESRLVMWGINSYPGSSVTVRDSALAMAMVRFAENNAYLVPGEFRNNTSYEDRKFASVPDRHLQMIRTSVQWWKLDVIDAAQARLDSVTFAEMMVKNSARAFLTNSICEGQTIHLGALNNAYVYFKDGEVWTHVSAWNQALMVLDGSLVDYRKAPIPHQTRNIAHHRARLYAINSELVAPPEAMESALVTFARLGRFEERQLETGHAKWAQIDGSAWIVKGPASAVVLDRWILALRAPGTNEWTEVAQGVHEVRDGPLAMIRPALIWRPGEYELRLTLVVRGDDPGTPHPTWAFPAIKKLIVK